MIKDCCNCKGKAIVIAPSIYAYKMESKFFCSYSCLRKYQQKHPRITKRHYEKA